eukprot:g62095.t1
MLLSFAQSLPAAEASVSKTFHVYCTAGDQVKKGRENCAIKSFWRADGALSTKTKQQPPKQNSRTKGKQDESEAAQIKDPYHSELGLRSLSKGDPFLRHLPQSEQVISLSGLRNQRICGTLSLTTKTLGFGHGDRVEHMDVTLGSDIRTRLARRLSGTHSWIVFGLRKKKRKKENDFGPEAIFTSSWNISIYERKHWFFQSTFTSDNRRILAVSVNFW